MKKVTPGTQVVILAGGLGTRLAEQTSLTPKPLVMVGNRPILWHIMKIFYTYGLRDFIICGGYKIEKIHEFFKHYEFLTNDYEYDFSQNDYHKLTNKSEDWNVKVINTGYSTNTGGRLKRIKNYLKDDQPFFATYGDGLADVDIAGLYDFHSANPQSLVTLTSVVPAARFGALEINENDMVTEFSEKPRGDGNVINGGFFVINKDALDHIEDDTTSWEDDTLTRLAVGKRLSAFHHSGFWQPMDTMRDNKLLNGLWEQGKPPWKIW